MNAMTMICGRCKGLMAHEYDLYGGGYLTCLRCGAVVWDRPAADIEEGSGPPTRRPRREGYRL